MDVNTLIALFVAGGAARIVFDLAKAKPKPKPKPRLDRWRSVPSNNGMGWEFDYKRYGKLLAENTSWRGACRVAADQEIAALFPPKSIDGVRLKPGDRILLTGQKNPAQNGIYFYEPMIRNHFHLRREGLNPDIICCVTEGEKYRDTMWTGTEKAMLQFCKSGEVDYEKLSENVLQERWRMVPEIERIAVSEFA